MLDDGVIAKMLKRKGTKTAETHIGVVAHGWKLTSRSESRCSLWDGVGNVRVSKRPGRKGSTGFATE